MPRRRLPEQITENRENKMKFTYHVFLGVLVAVAQPVSANIDIHFDYRYDSTGFFTGANSSRQGILEAAASAFENRFQDSLTAVVSSGSNNFDARFFQPDADKNITLSNFSVPADQIVVFVGAHDLGGSLAIGGPGGYSSTSGSSDFIDNATSRGQAGALSATETDFGPWGGSISFNSTSRWYFDPDARTDEPLTGYDLYSVAVHELAHVLGFGSAKSFTNLVVNNIFTGSAVHDLLGYNPTVTSGHWMEGLKYSGVETAMDPTIAQGQRKHFTELDYAAMKDMGWQVSPIPEPATWGMMLAGLGLLGWRLRTRQHAAA
jgi:hypothetical protein